MNKLKNLVLITLLSAGVAHATTAPCNGFKLEFKNKLHQRLIMDEVHFKGGTVGASGSNMIEAGDTLFYTVNGSSEEGIMQGEFLMYAPNEPEKIVHVNFTLKNGSTSCLVDNFHKEGTLDADYSRALGGATFRIKD